MHYFMEMDLLHQWCIERETSSHGKVIAYRIHKNVDMQDIANVSLLRDTSILYSLSSRNLIMIGITADKTWDAGSIMDLLTVARKLYLESVESYKCPFLY